jgi:histidinol-phosphatase (PHP family)
VTEPVAAGGRPLGAPTGPSRASPPAGATAGTGARAGGPAAADPPGRLELPLDAHLHTDLSPDSDVPIDAYCALAVDRGLAELAITDHIDFSPGSPAFGYADFTARKRQVGEAAERWAGRVAIRLGLEVTYERDREEEIRGHLRHHRYDYVIGSVHVNRGSPYEAGRVASFVAGRRLADVVAPYLDELMAAIQSGLFDTIGHFDYVKRYLVPHVRPAQLAAAPDLYEPLLRALVESGSALEVNSSGLRQAAAETYPSAAVVARYRELGGGAVVTGSDAHARRHFGVGLTEAYAILAGAGFEELAFRRAPGPGRATVAVPSRFLPNAGAGGSL